MKMKTGWLSLATLAVVLTGCGGGSGGGGTSALTAGRSALNSLSSGSTSVTPTSLQSALSLFQTALQQSPNDPQANFGAAVCLAGLVSQEIDGSSTPAPATSSTGGSSGIGPPPPPPGVTGGVTTTASYSSSETAEPVGYNGSATGSAPNYVAGLFWNLGISGTNPLQLLRALAPVTDLRFGLMPYFGYETDNVTGREQELTQLNLVDQQLTAIEAVPSFTGSITLPNGSTAVVGLPEVQLFHAYVDSLRTQLSLSLAYIRSVTNSTSSSLLPAVFLPSVPVDLNHDGKLEPNEYLPASPYLTLRDPSYMATAKSALQGEAIEEAAGISGVLARPADGSGGYLVPNSTTVNAALTQIQTQVLPILQKLPTGPVTVQAPQPVGAPDIFHPQARSTGVTRGDIIGSGHGDDGLRAFYNGGGSTSFVSQSGSTPTFVSVTIDLAAWFASPPADLKTLAPTYPLDTNGFPIISQATYPDPTFAGLFPNGLPSGFLF